MAVVAVVAETVGAGVVAVVAVVAALAANAPVEVAAAEADFHAEYLALTFALS